MFTKLYYLLIRFCSKSFISSYLFFYVKRKLYLKDKPGTTKTYLASVKLREKEYDSSKKIVITGDSVIFAGEDLWESIDPNNIRCTAIPGDDTTNFEKRLLDTVLIYQPEVVYLHIGCNDFIDRFVKQKPFDAHVTFDNIIKCIHIMKKSGVKKIFWMEILPLSKTLEILNKETLAFNMLMRQESMKKFEFEVLPTRDVLADKDGFIKEEYLGPDSIHCIKKAYTEAWVPQFKNSVEQFLN